MLLCVYMAIRCHMFIRKLVDSSITNKNIFIPDYQLPCRRDQNCHGGSVLVYVKKCLDCIPKADLNVSDTEIMWLELLLRSNKHAFLAVSHQPPALKNDKKLRFIDSLESSLDKIILNLLKLF